MRLLSWPTRDNIKLDIWRLIFTVPFQAASDRSPVGKRRTGSVSNQMLCTFTVHAFYSAYSAFRKYSDPLPFFHFCHVAARCYNHLNYFFLHINPHYPIMRNFLYIFANFLKRKSWNITLAKVFWLFATTLEIPLRIISLDHRWDVTTPWPWLHLANQTDWTCWGKAHTSL